MEVRLLLVTIGFRDGDEPLVVAEHTAIFRGSLLELRRRIRNTLGVLALRKEELGMIKCTPGGLVRTGEGAMGVAIVCRQPARPEGCEEAVEQKILEIFESAELYLIKNGLDEGGSSG